MTKINIACVIDDDPIYTFTIKRMIDRAQIAEKTLFFTDGLQAVNFFREQVSQTDALPDLVLLDINMPVLDGWQFMDEFVKLAPQINKEIAIYIVSSSIDEEDYRKAKSYQQVRDFIVKPITMDKISNLAEFVPAVAAKEILQPDKA